MQVTQAANSSRKEETGCIGWNMTAMKLEHFKLDTIYL